MFIIVLIDLGSVNLTFGTPVSGLCDHKVFSASLWIFVRVDAQPKHHCGIASLRVLGGSETTWPKRLMGHSLIAQSKGRELYGTAAGIGIATCRCAPPFSRSA